MQDPLLQFVVEPYAPTVLEQLLREFREHGYVILPQVYVRESVDAFVQQVKAALYFYGVEWTLPNDSPLIIWPAQAPRIRQALVPAFSQAIDPPLPALYMNHWIIQDSADPQGVVEWHKDREPNGMPGKEYLTKLTQP